MRIFMMALLLVLGLQTRAQQYYLFVGTYTNTGSKGIYVYSFDAATGRLDSVSHTEGIVNASYLTVTPDGTHVYACTETRTANAGSVSAFAFNRATGQLTFINKQPSGGDNPVYITLHKSGRWVVMGNYTGGTISVFPVLPDGSVGPYVQHIAHHGNSINKDRQEKAHVHSVNFSPDGRFLLVPDLGMDKLMLYRFTDTAAQPLQPAAVPFIITPPGSGPRHLAFHPNGRYMYLLHEMEDGITVFHYHALTGLPDSVQHVSTHVPGTKGPFRSADIHLSPDGKFLYATNREAERNIAIFSINQSNGRLQLLGNVPTQGEEPRNFIVEPTGNYVLVANQETNNIVVFKRDAQSGGLKATGVQVQVPLPTCLQMLKK